MDEMRIDKWLWAARFFKTRSAAQEEVSLGRVLVDGSRANHRVPYVRATYLKYVEAKKYSRCM